MNTRFTLAICELFSPTKHGKSENSSSNIDGQWLVYCSISLDEFYDNSYQEDINMLQSYNAETDLDVKLDIICMDELEQGGELVGYLQTHWLKILQRKWKCIYLYRRELIRKRSAFVSLRDRETMGHWPKGLQNWK